MSKVEELLFKAIHIEESQQNFNGHYEQWGGYVFNQESMDEFIQAVKQEEEAAFIKTENEWIDHLLSNIHAPKVAGEYLIDALEKTVQKNLERLQEIESYPNSIKKNNNV